MVATRKPWDVPSLKLLQKLAKSKTFHGSRSQTMGSTWPQTDQQYKYKLNVIEINVRINTESFCFHLVSLFDVAKLSGMCSGGM